MGVLDGKVALLSGGASGIGRAVVDAFTAQGAQVAVLDRSTKRLRDLGRDLPSVLRIQGDASDLEGSASAVRATVDAFGQLDVLATFVGVHDVFAGVVDLEPAVLPVAFDEIFRTNVLSYLLAVKAALPELVASRGNIILTASHAAFHAGGGGVLYTASKWAVRGLVMQLAHELAPVVRVNGVAPGAALTELRGLDALGQGALFSTLGLDEVRAAIATVTPLPYDPDPNIHAGAYVYLASDDTAGAVTGSVISSDGGSAVRGFTQPSGRAGPMLGGRIESAAGASSDP